jgi:phosphoribosylglycinamide formyltransferase-1
VKKIAILASGGGSNAEVIITHLQDSTEITVALIVSNNANAYVLERAKNHNIKSYVHSPEDVLNGKLLNVLKEDEIDFIVLAGYLKHINTDLLNYYHNKIVNIHPALLPKFGGKGMYGMNVHNAVVAAGEAESGITIHYVNEHYDEGAIIEQHKCQLDKNDAADEVQKKVLALEHKFFAPCIEELIRKI